MGLVGIWARSETVCAQFSEIVPRHQHSLITFGWAVTKQCLDTLTSHKVIRSLTQGEPLIVGGERRQPATTFPFSSESLLPQGGNHGTDIALRLNPCVPDPRIDDV